MDALRRTPFYDLHLKLGAKMVGFAGFDMPVQYPLGVMQEHRHTRTKAGLFDVSHMGQVILRGATYAAAASALERLIPMDVHGKPFLPSLPVAPEMPSSEISLTTSRPFFFATSLNTLS